LLNDDFSFQKFSECVNISKNTLSLHHKKISVVGKADGRIAQIIADYLRVKLLHSNLEFSFETVFFP